jgi:hypothetical protein
MGIFQENDGVFFPDQDLFARGGVFIMVGFHFSELN